MREKCVLAVGEYDLNEIPSLSRYVKRLGFKESSIEGVYYKGDYKQESWNMQYLE